jgi:exodeoxyribonuclease VIII
MHENTPMGHVEMTNDEYHAGPGVSKSHLDVIANQAPLHYWHKYLNPERERSEPTPAMQLGTCIHSAILEPDTLSAVCVPNPGIDRRSNAGKAEYAAFCAEHAGKIILADEDYQAVLLVRDAVYRHPVARGLLTDGKPEQTFFALDPEHNELVKCRFDYLRDAGDMAIDVKSTEDASPEGFGRSVANFRYDLQPPWYFDVMDILYGQTPQSFVYLAVEKKPPYAIGIYFATPEQIAVARDTARRDFGRIVQLKQTYGTATAWPDYGIEALPLELPKWMKR